MFHPSVVHHKSCSGTACALHIPDSFGVLCWNVHKNNRASDFLNYLKKLDEKSGIDLMLFQEASFENDGICSLESFAFDAAANMELGSSFYGVLTASRAESKESNAYLSEGKEAFMWTRKSLMLSRYTFSDNTPLLVLNIHAINFRESSSYGRELERFSDYISEYGGPVIVAGDFNSWSVGRRKKLDIFRRELGLESVPFRGSSKIKSFMGNHLDFIFYRGLKLPDSFVLDADGLSDHNPLYARFEKLQ